MQRSSPPIDKIGNYRKEQSFKVVANKDTLLLMMFFGWVNERDTIQMFCVHAAHTKCCGHKLFLTKIRNIFVSRIQILCLRQMLHARANEEAFESATLYPRLPSPLVSI